EALDSLLRDETGSSTAQAMKAIAPTWFRKVTPAAADAADGPAASPEQLKREFVAFFWELARGQPVLLFVDDLHWADVSTVDLLAYLAMRCSGLRLLAVVAYRPSELSLSEHPFLKVKWELQGRGLCRETALSLLTQKDVEHYLDLEYPG